MDRPDVGAFGPDVAAGGAFEGGRQECLTGWDSVAAPALWGDTALGVALLLKPHHDITTDITTDITDHIEPVRLAAGLITYAAAHVARPAA